MVTNLLNKRRRKRHKTSAVLLLFAVILIIQCDQMYVKNSLALVNELRIQASR